MSKTSESVKKRWQDPEYRAKQAASRARAAILKSEKMKANWANPEFRRKTMEAQSDPEVRAKMKAEGARIMTERWQDPEFRERQTKCNGETARNREVAPGFKDGRTGTVEYQAFHQAKARCQNPNHPSFPEYGGRGIKFLLNTFEEFIAAIGRKPSPSHSLDRINVNGHYEIGNLRWATDSEQIRNRRKFNCLTGYSDAEIAAEFERRLLLSNPEARS